MSGMALYRKWRPLTFSDVWGQPHITHALSSQVGAERVSHAYLFTGTRGTGKTTCAKILARAVNCLNPNGGNPCNSCESCRAALDEAALDITEIDAASNNGVDNIREMREEAFLAPTALKYRVYIIDEVHMLSVGAFNALLKILEEPPAHVIFILATTELHKVPATVLSRCQRYDFRRIAPEIIAQNLLRIASEEGTDLSPDAAELLARLGDGSARDAISLLDRCMDGGAINREKVTQALGLATDESVAALLEAIAAGDAARALTVFGECYMEGRDIVSLLDELLSLLRDVYVVKVTGGAGYLLGQNGAAAQRLASGCDAPALEYLVWCLSELLRRFTRTAIRRTDAEMCIFRMCLRDKTADAAAHVIPVLAKPAPATASAPDLSKSIDPPWEPAAEEAAKPVARPAKAEDAKQKEPESKASAGEEELDALINAASPNVNSGVRAYLSLAECENIDNILHIYVAEESLVFMEKPAVLEALDAAARSLGHLGVNIHGPRKDEGAPPGAKDILSRAKRLGVNVTGGSV